ncbi:MAG: hypothetical protein K6G76_03465 [Lachnospiraceae bacterium]|nr:hypothetical protein [Lachnospiraceae bacterium]
MGEKLSQILYDLEESHSIVKKMLSRLCVVERELNSCFPCGSTKGDCRKKSKNKCGFDKRI